MKKLILSFVAIFTAMGLYADETTVEKLQEHYSAEANKTEHPLIKEIAKGLEEKVSQPTQRAKNLNEAVERWSDSKASNADKELIKSEYEPFIKKLQGETVYEFNIEIDNPLFVHIAALAASLPTVATTWIDFYMIRYCTNDISKITLKDLANIGTMKEYSPIVNLKFASESQNHPIKANKEDYVKFVHAARALNCGDDESLKKYLQKDNEFEGTFVAGLSKEDMGNKPVLLSYKNEAGNECFVTGRTSATIPSLGGQYERVEIKLEKETCKSGEAFIINGYATKTDGNLIFSDILPGDKVKILKNK